MPLFLRRRAVLLLVAGFSALPVAAQDGTSAGELWIEPPTLVSLGFEWAIEGDANRNAEVRLYYRASGEADWSAATGQDTHSVLVDYDAFAGVSPPGPDPTALYNPSDFDFRLRPGSIAVDAGVRLAGINDDMTGEAPDLGAYELGRPVPGYGPRP